MKHFNNLGIFGWLFILPTLISGIFNITKDYYKPERKKVCLEDELISRNNNRVFYVVHGYKNTDGNLRQYISFYLPDKQTGSYCEFYVHEYTKLKVQYERKGQFRNTIICDNMALHFIEKAISDKYGKKVKLIRLDEDIVNGSVMDLTGYRG